MFSWPNGNLKPGERHEVISSIDLFPTALAAAGVSISQDVPGLNLLESMQKNRAIDRSGIFGEGFAHDIADIEKPEASLLYRWRIEGKWKLLLTYDGEVNRYKSSHPREELRPQLFDLSADPHEKTNVAAEHPDVVSRMATKIQSWWPVEERKTLMTFE